MSIADVRAAALRFVLEREGVRFDAAGHVIDSGANERPDDPGGLTVFGIAINRHPELTRAQLLAMTYPEAAAFWIGKYWTPVRGDELAALAPWLAFVLFDTAGPHGAGGAVKLLQRAIGFKGDQVDGGFGPVTLAAVRAALARDARDLAVELMAQRILFDVQAPAWPGNGRGWTRRTLALMLAAGVP